ncbi:hypothetical protein [Aeromicrobium sp. UC242_57]|uniref:hypothetical protein n=1 Tax=Aeromicrobium sp. UC242_57 TaxID=3374624 RepID=UPI0037A40DDD
MPRRPWRPRASTPWACSSSFAADVDTFDTTVNQINIDYKSQYNSTVSGMRQQPEHKSGDEPIDYAGVAASTKSNLMPRYKTAETVIDDAADAIAAKFKQGPTDENVRELIRAGLIPLASAGLYPTLVLTDDDKRQALKSSIAGMTPAEQAEFVKNHPEFDAELVEVLSPDAQEILANDVANDIKNDKVDAETVRIMALLSTQPAFTNTLFDEVEPADLAKVIKTLEEDAFPQPGTEDLSQDKIDLYKDFLTAAGTSFATYTKGEGEYAPPADLSKTWYDAITGDDGYGGNAAALTLMLRAGGAETSFDTDFLADLTGDLYDWERDQDGAVWGPRDYDGIVDPFATKIDEGRHFATDGLANMLGAMENSPGAAQKFFHEGYPDGDTSEENDRLKYLLTERTFSDSAYSDEGDGLGAALEAAATGNREHTLIPGTSEYGDDWSANFASEVFNTIADKSGTGDGFGPDDVWHIWPDMADNLGAIGASYSSDIYDIVGRAPVPGGPHLQIDLADLDKVFGEIGRGDKTGIETLSAGIMLEGNDRLQDAIDQWKQAHPGEPIDLESVTEGALGEALRGTGGTSGEILGHIVNKAITVDEHDKSLAETRAAYVSKAIDIAGGFIPGAGSVLGEGASELLKSGYDVAKSEGLDLLKNAVEGSGSATGGDYERSERSSLSQSLENNITSQLIRSGVITVGDGPGQIPASLVTDGPDGTQVLNPDLYDADGPDKIGEDGQYTQAEKNQMLTDLNRWFGDIDSRYVESITQPAQDGLDREPNK